MAKQLQKAKSAIDKSIVEAKTLSGKFLDWTPYKPREPRSKSKEEKETIPEEDVPVASSSRESGSTKTINDVIKRREHILKFCREIWQKVHENLHRSPKSQLYGDSQDKSRDIQEVIQVLSLQEHFSDIDPENINLPRESVEFMQEIRRRADFFRNKIDSFSGTNFSVEFFVIDENLTRLVEALDKVKCRRSQEVLGAKIETLNYITELQQILDNKATTD